MINNVNTRYVHSIDGKLNETWDSAGNSFKMNYDANGNIAEMKDVARNDIITYGYDKEGRQSKVTKGANNLNFTYDVAGRLTGKNFVNGTSTFNTAVSYKAGINGSATPQVSSISNKGVAITYTYDANNNITSYVRGGKTVSFVYDELNQLTRENNQEINKTITYTYNAGGNITSKKEYAYTTGTPGTVTKTYAYVYGDTNWKDKMTSFDGKALTYDAIGNPTTYNGWTYTWEQGRQLAGASKTGTTISYKYNDNGIRTSKTVNGIVTNYTLFGDKVVVEKTGTDTMKYTYDSQGNIVSMNLNGTEYFYEFNAQGDIIGLFNTAGTKVVNYVYDTWGKVISTTGTLASTVGAKNPYRYRIYRLDTETGMYYLQSRYYVPEWSRFLNADASQVLGLAQGQLLSANLFAYCSNNPVISSDPYGYWAYRISNYTLRQICRTIFLSFCINPVGMTLAALGIWKVYSIIVAGAVSISARLGLFIGGPMVSVITTILTTLIAGWAGWTVAQALIEGKGLKLEPRYTYWGMPYMIELSAD